MPLGFQRLNERIKRPNEFINFIKPIKGPDQATSQDFLEHIAAIVYPVMKANHIAVMALEEFPSNREFWGRNFNAGEVIQLVLKSPSGAWLSFRHVQMVMIHELAHCKEMNHSRFFWSTRNGYADELRSLWQKGYTGEGFWGAGRGIHNGAYLRNEMPVEENMPETLCGGIYRNKGKRRRGKKDSGKPELSWAERRQRRILKKFGVGGTALGGDEEERQKLEQGKKVKGKPRVAASVRARELRAAAALARFEKMKTKPVKTESDMTDSESDYSSGCEDDRKPTIKTENKELVRICDSENADDEGVKQEQREMGNLWQIPEKKQNGSLDEPSSIHHIGSSRYPQADLRISSRSLNGGGASDASSATPLNHVTNRINFTETSSISSKQPGDHEVALSGRSGSHVVLESVTCVACSCSNGVNTVICVACSNVLDPKTTWNHWRCRSPACKDGVYINLGDYGRCQLCGSKKPD